jgi:hypothetical protein
MSHYLTDTMKSLCYGIPAEVIARICCVDVATARRWKRGATQMPKTSAMILAGDLGCFTPAWRGWRLAGDKLISPEGWEITTGDVLSIPLLRAQISAYQAKERTVNAMEEQPAPGTVPAIVA